MRLPPELAIPVLLPQLLTVESATYYMFERLRELQSMSFPMGCLPIHNGRSSQPYMSNQASQSKR